MGGNMIPKVIERYYTAELFRLIQKELALKNITVNKHSDLAMMNFMEIGKFTTMYLQGEKLCVYSEAKPDTLGLTFEFNGEMNLVKVPQLLMMLWHALLVWDIVAEKVKNIWFDIRYSWRR